MHKVVVLLSVYHGSRLEYVADCLSSIYAQSFKEFDIFIQEDGVIPVPLHTYLMQQLQDKKIHYLGQREENLGIAHSYNELILKALDENYLYFVRMDSDDIMLPNRIQAQYDFMQEHKDIDVVGSYIEEFGDGFSYQKIVRYPLKHSEMFNFFAKRVPLANVTSFFRASFFKKSGLYPTSSKTNEDTLLWAKGFQNQCKFANIPKVLVRVRISLEFFNRRGGLKKAWCDFKDRIYVIQVLRYNFIAYVYAVVLFLINISPAFIKKIAYKRFR